MLKIIMDEEKLVIRLPVLRRRGATSEADAKMNVPHQESPPGAAIIFSDFDIMSVSCCDMCADF